VLHFKSRVEVCQLYTSRLLLEENKAQKLLWTLVRAACRASLSMNRNSDLRFGFVPFWYKGARVKLERIDNGILPVEKNEGQK
jgi:hypothetical protein